MPGRFYRYALDDVCVVQIHDGWDHHAPAHDYFGTNVDDLTFDEECISLGTSPAEFDFPVTMTLIESGGQRVLIDAGFGPSGPSHSGGLPKGLAALGIDPGSVDVVVMSHLHGDHTGGLMTEDSTPRFPNARHLIAADEANAAPADPALAALGALVELVTPGYEVLPGIVLVDMCGHTPGHLGVLIASNSGSVLVASDLANHPVWAFAHPEWHMRFDADGEKAAAMRAHWLGRAADEKLVFAGYHMPFPALGRVERVGAAFRYVPLDLDVAGSASAA
jgi:glyoxylase-like metal-dependent hydrolase (beta-lactamase superfamily II)